jgi:type IV secretion system protein VirB10
MTDELDKDLLERDVDGSALRLRPVPPQTGARLSKNFKKVAAAALGLVSAGILVGIFTAGNHPRGSGKGNGTGAQTAMVGETQPDLDAMERNAAERARRSAQSTLGVGAGGAALGTQAGSLSLPSGAAGQAPALRSGQPATDPAGKYRQWLTDERYKVLENQGLAAESATSAKLVPEGSEPTGTAAPASAAPSATSAENPVSQLLQTAQQLQASSGQPATAPSTLASLATGALPGQRSGDNTIPSTAESQATNRAFLDGQIATGNGGYLTVAVQPPAANYELFAGSVIPAVLVTGIQSDLPGSITALVRQTIYDSRHPEVVLIPQGTRLIGLYTSQIAYGQRRVLVAWSRLIFPNGSTLELGGMEGTDGLGEAGLSDLVNNHYERIFGSAILMSLLGAGAELSQPQNSSALTAPSMSQQTAAAVANELNQVGTTLIGKNLAIQPTLTIRPGYAFDVFVNRTMILKPYADRP